MSESPDGLVYVVILNWLRWEETIPCLETVLKLEYENTRVIICDNASSNDSVAKITAWLEGRLDIDFSEDARADLITPCAPKPVAFRHLREEDLDTARREDVAITLISNWQNHGYAGGNNVGIRYALEDPRCIATWILNNDVAVTPGALSPLVAAIDERAGILGSRILNYTAGDLQMPGGASYNRFSGKSRFLPRDGSIRHERLDYIAGCSMLLSRQVLEATGLLCEDYFLFYEEFDFTLRARQTGFRIRYVPESVVYHKQAATTGKAGVVDFYTLRNRLVFTRRFFPRYYPSVFVSVLLTAGVRVLRGRPRQAYQIFRLALNPDQDYDACDWGAAPPAGERLVDGE